MAELRFLGLSQDGSQLLLADSRGRKHSVPVDPRLMAAMRLDGHPTGQREIALNTTFSPRQIQARLRSGATVADLADEYGVPEEKVERFAGPPLADRAFTADQARRTLISSHLGERPLDVVVGTAVEASGVDTAEIRWDAWIREDGTWQVLSSYPTGTLDQVATWVFDPRESSLRPDDDTAASLLAGPEDTHTRPSVRAVSSEDSGAQRTSSSSGGSQPDAPESAGAPPEDSVTEHPAPEANDDAGSPATPAKTTRRGKRASVPTWDEILFGSQAPDSDPAT